MWLLLLALLLVAEHGNSRAAPPSFVHTADSLVDAAESLAGNCESGELTVQRGDDLPTATFVSAAAGVGDGSMLRVVVFQGEHPREVVGTEVGLGILEALCAEANLPALRVVSVLLVNPWGRQQVDQGKMCLRTNENDVDLNRNWDASWDSEPGDLDQVDPGPQPFSEPETQYARSLMEKEQPSLFVSIHSGTEAILWSGGKESDGSETEQLVADWIAQAEVDLGLGNVPAGTPKRILGYEAPGNCVLYARNAGVRWSMAWEVFGAPRHRAASSSSSSSSSSFRSGRGARYHQLPLTPADAFQRFLRVESTLQHSPESCWAIFNPDSEAEMEQTVQRWSSAFADLVRVAYEAGHRATT